VSVQQIEMLCQAFSDMNRGDLAAVMVNWDDQITFVFPGTTRLGRFYQGKEEVERCLWTLQQLMPDVRIEVINTFDGPDIVAAEWLKRSTAPDGRTFENRGVTVAEFRDNKVIAMRDYMDTEKLSLLAPPRKPKVKV
jgi:ketosteroid isomerase-like protein